jgi:hypothetical protein
VETAEHKALASASTCGVGDDVYALQVIRTSDDVSVMLFQIVGEKVAL